MDDVCQKCGGEAEWMSGVKICLGCSNEESECVCESEDIC